MYIIKNAYRNITRSKSRNLIIGIIITAITISACITLSIHASGDTLIESYKNNNPLEITLQKNHRREKNQETTTTNSTITIENIENYGDSDYVSDYYYTTEASLSSTDTTPVSYEEQEIEDIPYDTEEKGPQMERQKMDIGDFRITGYSNTIYNEEFISGNKKIIEGTMIHEESEENDIVISEELAEENELEIGDTITLYHPDNEEKTYEFTIVGIYEIVEAEESNNFMNINALNSANQIYANVDIIQSINSENTSNSFQNSQNLTVKFYLTNNNVLESFEAELREKGLGEDYQLITNETEVLQTLKPIQNISTFSMTFLIVILIIGGIILAFIQALNIRERKYEIGVLRAIGMSKLKLTLQLICEIFIVSIISLIIGTTIGILTAQPITNAMLKNEIKNMQQETQNIQENFGSDRFERPNFQKQNIQNPNMNMDETTYVDTLNVTVDIFTIFKLLSLSLLLTNTSSLITITYINRYEPNKILQNR